MPQPSQCRQIIRPVSFSMSSSQQRALRAIVPHSERCRGPPVSALTEIPSSGTSQHRPLDVSCSALSTLPIPRFLPFPRFIRASPSCLYATTVGRTLSTFALVGLPLPRLASGAPAPTLCPRPLPRRGRPLRVPAVQLAAGPKKQTKKPTLTLMSCPEELPTRRSTRVPFSLLFARQQALGPAPGWRAFSKSLARGGRAHGTPTRCRKWALHASPRELANLHWRRRVATMRWGAAAMTKEPQRLAVGLVPSVARITSIAGHARALG